MRFPRVPVAVAAILLAPGSPPAQGQPVTTSDLEQAAGDTSSWLMYGRDYHGHRFVELDEITPENVDRLHPAWVFATGGENRGLEATPLVHEGVIYLSADESRVFAIDARTGARLWGFEPEMSDEVERVYCCGSNNRGVALYADLVYVGTMGARLFALHRDSYFTAPDYVGYSVNKLTWAIVLTLAYMAGMFDRFVRTPTLPRRVYSQHVGGRSRMLWLMVIVTVVASPVAFVWMPVQFHLRYVPMVWWIGIYYIERFLVPRYFKNYRLLPEAAGTVSLFLVLVWTSAKGNAYRVMVAPPQEFSVLTGERNYSESTHRLLGGNSGYFFLWNESDGMTAVPKQSVKYVATEYQENAETRVRSWLQNRLARFRRSEDNPREAELCEAGGAGENVELSPKPLRPGGGHSR